ncbi:Nucleolar RNA helicase 2 [Quaeritorhiza haematococci]|nr:Nucleolar RNA helicase 2 [Quaeritorhiza haematococci]
MPGVIVDESPAPSADLKATKKSKKSVPATDDAVSMDVDVEESSPAKKSKKEKKQKKKDEKDTENGDAAVVTDESSKDGEKKKKKKKSAEGEAMEGVEDASAKKTKKRKRDKSEDAAANEDADKTKKSDDATTLESTKPEKRAKLDESAAKSDTTPSTTAAASNDTPDLPDNLKLSSYPFTETTLAALKARGVTQLFPIQAACFSHVMDGKDVVGRARTGTGKTLAFALPMVESLKKDKKTNPAAYSKRGRAPRVLVMTPTRELCLQVSKEFESVAANDLALCCIYGGVPYDSQYFAMKNGVDVVIGTPGRLIDHVERGNLKLHDLMFVCMDEADQMLDRGFAENMDMILDTVSKQKSACTTPAPEHQTLLFSATLPDWIRQAINKFMRPGDQQVTVDLVKGVKLKTSTTIRHLAVPSRWQNRASVLGDIVAVYGRGSSGGRTIIFVETKGEANELALNEKLKDSQVIHGDIVQKQREISMQGFRDGRYRVLITTNVCARGVDIPEVDCVINCEPPNDVETYIHRSGRTGRAGRSGVCVTFYKPQQEYLLNLISKRAGT